MKGTGGSIRFPGVASYPLLLAGIFSAFLGVAGLCGFYIGLICLVDPLRALAPLSVTPAFDLIIVGAIAISSALGLRRTALAGGLLGLVLIAVLAVGASPYTHGALHRMLVHANEIQGTAVWTGPLSECMAFVGVLGLLFTALRGMPLAGGFFGALLLAFSGAALVGQLSPIWPIWKTLGFVAPQVAVALCALSLALLASGWQDLKDHSYGFAVLAAIGSITVSIMLAGAMRAYERAELRRTSLAEAYSVADQLAGGVSRPVAIQAMIGRWQAFGVPPRRRAQGEARLLMRDMPEIAAIGWIAPSAHPVWWVSTRPPSGAIVKPLLEYHVRRLRILQYARRERHLVMTPPVRMLGHNRSFIVVEPVYRHGVLRGYLLSVFDAYRWLAHLIARQVARGYYVQVLYGGIPLFTRGTRGYCQYMQQVHVRFLGRRFRVTVCPQRRIVKQTDVGLPALMLISGSLLALFAAAAVNAMQRARWHAQLLDSMNSELEILVASRTAALKDERERWRVTLMSIGDGVILTDTEGCIQIMNEAAEHFTGYTNEAAHGRFLSSVLPLRDAATQRLMDRPRATNWGERGVVAHSAGMMFKDAGGRDRFVSDSIAPVQDERGAIAGFVVVFRDMTEHRALEEEAMKARSLEALGVLAGGIAHDFNNILTAIIGNIALAKLHGGADKRLLAALDDAEQSGWRARGLTLQLLTFAKGGAPVMRSGLIAEAIRDLVRFFLKGSRVRAVLDLPDDLWAAEFDRDQMGQVIQNVVLNAMEAMNEGGTLCVQGANVVLREGEVADLPGGSYVMIRFTDSGPGIKKEFLDRIFDPYFSLKSTGTGLGLAVAYSIMRRHHGAIVAQSAMGIGTTMILYLPRSYTGVVDVSAVGNARKPAGNGERILLMDDDEAVRKAGKALLAALGYEVIEAASGEEALRYFREDPDGFAAAILDLTVAGGMGGERCIAELRKIRPHVRALVSTGYSTDPVVARYRDYGFVGTIQKPYRLDDLASILSAVLYGPPDKDGPPTSA